MAEMISRERKAVKPKKVAGPFTERNMLAKLREVLVRTPVLERRVKAMARATVPPDAMVEFLADALRGYTSIGPTELSGIPVSIEYLGGNNGWVSFYNATPAKLDGGRLLGPKEGPTFWIDSDGDGRNSFALVPFAAKALKLTLYDADAPEAPYVRPVPLGKTVAQCVAMVKKGIGPKLKKKLGFQGGDVLEDGSIIADPAQALLELHDQVNTLPATDLVQTLPWPTPPVCVARVPTLAELAAPFGSNRREREVVKKRFRSLCGKLTKLPEGERRAFLEYINEVLK
jgi:hypothetical protein